jgi:hypothetical protein
MPQKAATLKNQKRYPWSHSAAVHFGVDRKTLHRALRGEFPNPALVDGYVKFVNDQLLKLIGPRGATAAPSSHAPNQKKRKPRLSK